MQFVYKPEGVEKPQKWPFDPERLMSPEAIAIEKLSGMTFVEWQDAVGRGSMAALHALLYVMLKRESPNLKPDEVQFSLADVDIELDDDEIAEKIAELQAKSSRTDEDNDLLERLLKQQKDSVGEAPKAPIESTAPVSSVASSTPSFSPTSAGSQLTGLSA